MIAFIFKATLNQHLLSKSPLDSQNQVELKRYLTMADTLRDKALSKYGCISFVSTNQGDQEIVVSYLPDIEEVRQWKNDGLHLQAQQMGREKWYKHYSVDIVEVLRSYEHSNPSN